MATTYNLNLWCFVWGKKILGQPGILIQTCQLFDSLTICKCYLFWRKKYLCIISKNSRINTKECYDKRFLKPKQMITFDHPPPSTPRNNPIRLCVLKDLRTSLFLQNLLIVKKDSSSVKILCIAQGNAFRAWQSWWKIPGFA